MLGALGEHEHFAALVVSVHHVRHDGRRALGIVGQSPEYLLDARALGDEGWAGQHARDDGQVVRGAGRARGGMADRPALHENDGLLPIAADRGRRQPEHVTRGRTAQQGFERHRRQVMAFVDD
ncbi:hypothetical protein D3C77_459830 [compost metagenome]